MMHSPKLKHRVSHEWRDWSIFLSIGIILDVILGCICFVEPNIVGYGIFSFFSYHVWNIWYNPPKRNSIPLHAKARSILS
jgi:hypothetical protein